MQWVAKRFVNKVLPDSRGWLCGLASEMRELCGNFASFVPVSWQAKKPGVSRCVVLLRRQSGHLFKTGSLTFHKDRAFFLFYADRFHPFGRGTSARAFYIAKEGRVYSLMKPQACSTFFLSIFERHSAPRRDVTPILILATGHENGFSLSLSEPCAPLALCHPRQPINVI